MPVNKFNWNGKKITKYYITGQTKLPGPAMAPVGPLKIPYLKSMDLTFYRLIF